MRDEEQGVTQEPFDDAGRAFAEAPDLQVDAGEELFYIEFVVDLTGADRFGKTAQDPPESAQLRIFLGPLDFGNDGMHRLAAVTGAALQKRQQRFLEAFAQGDVIDGAGRCRVCNRRQRLSHRKVGKKQIGRMHAFDATRMQQILIIRKQPHWLWRSTRQQFLQIFTQRAIRLVDCRDDCRGPGQLARLEPVEHVFDGFGDDRNAVDVDHLQGAMRLVQQLLRPAQQRLAGIRIRLLREGVCQRGFRAAQGFTDFARDPGQRRAVETVIRRAARTR